MFYIGGLGFVYQIIEQVTFTRCAFIIDSVDSISRDEPDSPLTQYITNAGITRTRYTITLLKHHHRVLRLSSNRMSISLLRAARSKNRDLAF